MSCLQYIIRSQSHLETVLVILRFILTNLVNSCSPIRGLRIHQGTFDHCRQNELIMMDEDAKCLVAVVSSWDSLNLQNLSHSSESVTQLYLN